MSVELIKSSALRTAVSVWLGSLCTLGTLLWLLCSFKVPWWDGTTINSHKAGAGEQLGPLMTDTVDLCCAMHEFLPRDTPWVSSQHVSCHSVPSGSMVLLLVAGSACGHSILAENTNHVPCGCYQPASASPEEQRQKWGCVSWSGPQCVPPKDRPDSHLFL